MDREQNQGGCQCQDEDSEGEACIGPSGVLPGARRVHAETLREEEVAPRGENQGEQAHEDCQERQLKEVRIRLPGGESRTQEKEQECEDRDARTAKCGGQGLDSVLRPRRETSMSPRDGRSHRHRNREGGRRRGAPHHGRCGLGLG